MIETIRVAFAGLVANKLRSGLTILGLMIGVGSVIVLIAVGTGSSDAVQEQIDALGSNVLLVQSATGARRACAARRLASTALTLADATALQNTFQAPDVASVSPVVTANGVTLTYNGATYSPTQFIGTTPSYESGPQLHDGRGLLVHQQPGEQPQPRAGRRPDGREPAVRRPGPGRRHASRSTARATRSSASPRRRDRTGPPTRTTSRSLR